MEVMKEEGIFFNLPSSFGTDQGCLGFENHDYVAYEQDNIDAMSLAGD
jgi:hypothetical protein